MDELTGKLEAKETEYMKEQIKHIIDLETSPDKIERMYNMVKYIYIYAK